MTIRSVKGLSMAMLASIMLAVVSSSTTAATDPATGLIKWQQWSDDLFAQAKRENRFVLLDLGAVWCHWCHVMDQQTYGNARIAKLINAEFIPVRVDQDANPDISNRYGEWGWPATIVFAPDGTEIVKRRGYLPPVVMLSMLQAIVADPSPGPSVLPQPEIEPGPDAQLSDAQLDTLETNYLKLYDNKNGGWGTVHKFIDDEAMSYALSQARLNKDPYARMARQTLDAALNLIDREWGGVYQYSDEVDWLSPHYEKIMSTQASYVRQYAAGYALWGDPMYLGAARDIHRYLTAFLLSPQGAFYTSQNADLNAQVDGHAYYALGSDARHKLGIPRIDKHIYARENGWAIQALAALYDATDDKRLLEQAETAAEYIMRHRALPGGGFSHGETDRAGPYLDDTLAMGEALLDLHRATGEREWLRRAERALRFIEGEFHADDGGFITATPGQNAVGVFREPVKLIQENVDVARLSNRLHRYTGKTQYGGMAQHAMRYLTSPALLESQPFLPGVLLADYELSHEPVHITAFGRNDNVRSAAYRDAIGKGADGAQLHCE